MPDPAANRLAGETSPYLLQHAHNPVHWQPWDAMALAAARRDSKPILLSIGYSACHWCHVMAHESFENEATAAVMNQLFVNIKVDREERPDLDQIYQTAHQMLTGRAGGWPLTMFLAPDGTPFFGGTYFPDEPRYGMPAFTALCERVERLYRERGDDIGRQNAQLQRALDSTLPRHDDAAPLDGKPLAAAQAELLAAFDPEYGGFGGAPKFPHPTDIAFLMNGESQPGAAHAAALHSLRSMADGGIYDQIGGGFCRYSVDERWEIPHFEKMLYDNALLLPLYAEAACATGEPQFARVAEGIAIWLMREMQAADGGYYSSLDADSEGEEGRFYVWDRDAIRAALTADEWQAVAAHWGLDGPANFEGRHWHLRIAQPPFPAAADAIAAARAKLFALREARVHPGRDEKILASWNALAIAGMARAARILGRPAWLASARRALDFVHDKLWNDGRMLATCKDGRAHLDAYLDDHAFLLAALLETMQAEFRGTDLDWAVAVADTLLARFEDKESGGFFFTAHDHERLIHRPKPAHDNATPAGNGVAATALQRLGHLLGEVRYLDAARRTLQLFAPQLGHAGSASLLAALDELVEPPTIVFLRGPAPDVGEWQRSLARAWRGLCFALPNGTALPGVLAKPESAAVNAWVCSGVSCSAPIARLDELGQVVLSRHRFPLDFRPENLQAP
jgi:hypothetical protein